MIFLGADHRGFELKEDIKKYLDELGLKYEDLGNQESDPGDDYTVFAISVAKKVSEAPDKNKGILICGTGIGMDITANKFKGVRGALALSDFLAQRSREHNNTNVLTLASEITDKKTARKIIKVWLDTPFSNKKRHVRRLKQIEKIKGK